MKILTVVLILSTCYLPVSVAQDLSQYQLEAHYTLVNTAGDVLGHYDTTTLINAPYAGENGVFSYGGYLFDTIDEDSSLVITPRIEVLDESAFAIQLEFMQDSLEARNRPVVMVGDSWRYLGLSIRFDSTFGVYHNGAEYATGSQKIQEGVWHTFTLTWDSADSLAVYYLDGDTIFTRKGSLTRTEGDTQITNQHAGNAQTYRGFWRNLKVYGPVTTSIKQVERSASQLTAFPNPSHGRVTIALEEAAGEYDLLLADDNGRTVLTHSRITLPFTLQHLPPGMYIAHIYQDGISGYQKVVVH